MKEWYRHDWPLAMVQTIERYLELPVNSEEDLEEDIDFIDAAAMFSTSGLQFLNMTVYQAIKQYSSLINAQSETQTQTRRYQLFVFTCCIRVFSFSPPRTTKPMTERLRQP